MSEDREQKKKINLMKKIKTIKVLAAACGGSFPIILIVALVLISAIGALLPIFMVTTMVGGTTVYGDGKDDVPTDLTVNGIDKWSEEEKQFFEILTKEKKYFDGDFNNYNASKIMKNKDDIMDVSTPVSTTQYQGTINLTTLGDEYITTIFDDGTTSIDYKNEENVKNSHTRDFYKQASNRLGNTFMIYPGMRMLLGNMVKNSVDFGVIHCGYKECDASTFSNWSLLGKITSSNEYDAAKGYGVSEAVQKMSAAITYGENTCDNNSDKWLRENACYDTDLLFTELFGERFSLSEKSVITYLQDRFSTETDKVFVPVATLMVDGYYPAGNYIDVTVKKSIDYDLYEKYLKKVYIPNIYIDCDTCEYKDSSDELKQSKTDKIYDEIMQLTNSFKHYNLEDYTDGSTTTGTGGFGRVVPSSGYDYLPDEYYNQLISPLIGQDGTTTLTSCVGYYDALENTSYYCTGHNAVDMVGGGGTIVAPADGVITSCYTDYGYWGPLLGITHTLKDKNGNDTKVTSWYRHWVDLNGNVDCSTLYEGRVVKQGEQLAKESNQGGSYSIARHLHFKLTASDGTVYYTEDFLKSKGVNTSSVNGTTDCDQVRRTCNAYCEDKRHGCTSTY